MGYEYKLVSDSTLDKIGAMGRLISKDQCIQIASDIHEQQKISSVLHEVLEALNYHLELKLDHPTIMSLESVLYQTLTDNGVDLTPLVKEINGRN